MTRSILITPLNVVLIVAILGLTSAGFLLVPAGTIMPIHWGATGEADGFADRSSALLMAPILAAVLLLLFYAIIRFGRPATIEAGRHGISVAISGLLGLLLII